MEKQQEQLNETVTEKFRSPTRRSRFWHIYTLYFAKIVRRQAALINDVNAPREKNRLLTYCLIFETSFKDLEKL